MTTGVPAGTTGISSAAQPARRAGPGSRTRIGGLEDRPTGPLQPGLLPGTVTYRSHCHTGRLSRSSAGGSSTGAGCQSGYSPCLPRVADLNCGDIPASKRPVRVTGSDPYRLDADHDGWGCDS